MLHIVVGTGDGGFSITVCRLGVDTVIFYRSPQRFTGGPSGRVGVGWGIGFGTQVSDNG